MKTKKLKNLVKKAKGELTWPVEEVLRESDSLRIFSNPTERKHSIYLSATHLEGGPVHDLRYLHELGHALLCERAHPFFASSFPIIGLEKELFPAIGPVLSAASDWFIGHWLIEFCPELAIAELQSEYEATAEMMASGETPSLDKFFIAVLITAQSIKYLKSKVACSGFLDSAVQAFLAVEPDNPSAGKLVDLINRLLTLGAPYRCRQINRHDQEVLEFFRNTDNSIPTTGAGHEETA